MSKILVFEDDNGKSKVCHQNKLIMEVGGLGIIPEGEKVKGKNF